MMTSNRWPRVATATAVVAASALLAGCGGSRSASGDSGTNDPGITDSTVKVGATFPLTGVAAPGYSDIPIGAKAYFDYVNDHGGVDGRKIDYTYKDDGYNPTNTSSVTNELVLKDQVFATVGSLGTPTHSAVVSFLNQQKVPDLFVSSGALAWGDDVKAKPWTFGWQPDYETEGKIIGQWVKDNMPDAKVGLFLQDDDLGADSEKGVRQYLSDQIVATARYTSGNTDVAPQVSALKSKGADLVLSFNTPAYTALTQLTAQKLNYKPQWFYSNIGSDPALVGSLLNRFSEGAVSGSSNALDGVLTDQYIPGVDATDNPWVQLWQKVWKANGGSGDLTNYRIYGMSEAYAFVQALKDAGPDPTRKGLVAAAEKDLTGADGPELAPFRYSTTSHMGISGVQIVRLKGGKADPVTGVLTTDIGNAPITKDDSGQASDAPPSSGIPGKS